MGAAVRLDGAKILGHGTEAVAYFDLHNDPSEVDPLRVPESQQDAADEVRRILAREPPKKGKRDDLERERLRALGYVE